MPTLLVVDDEPNVLYSLEKALQADGLRVLTAATARQGIRLVEEQKPDAVILDVRLPDLPGLEAFDHMRRLDPRLPVIVMTAYAATETAIEAMKRGALEYLLKPVDLRQLRDLVARALELSRQRHVPAVFEENGGQDDKAVDRIVGRSPAMHEVYKAVGRIARQNMTVLITGESGTGKELIARAVYQHSERAQAAFLTINCAAIPEPLLESELFGHERGAFTGADRRRIGKFEQASGGTLFLDEIGDMTPATQAKVLRLLQEQRFERVGGNETIQTDVRILAATNRDLEALVAAGSFRKDLFYRLKVFTIVLPPLRERREDIPLLADYFVRQGALELGKTIRGLAEETRNILEQYDWPGNVRELQSALKYALVHTTSDVVVPETLPEEVRASDPSRLPSSAALDVVPLIAGLLQAEDHDIYRKVTQTVDRVLLAEVLRHVGGNQVLASELLGISRTTLRNKLRTLGLALGKQVLPQSGHVE